jgi:cyclopropane-fatty-acyl-phospholipid synthase
LEEEMELLAKSLFRETPSLVSTELLETLLADYPRRDFQVRLWDGTTWGVEKQPRFTLVLKDAGALCAMFLSPSELTLGEAYIYDDFDIEGDIEAAFELAEYLLGQERSLGESFDLNDRLQKLPKSDLPRTILHPTRFSGPVHSKDRD